MKLKSFNLLVISLTFCLPVHGQNAVLPYQDSSLPVELRVSDLVSSVTTPVRALKGFEKIYLRRGETRRVVMHVAADDLKLWNQKMQFVLEPGEFEVHVGSSSEDIRLQGNFEISTK
ncbi:MAG: fibronectin type III-like domain-contianing protein [Bacteroidales bacterium]|nr:fibronectin type III-like domain-contianing protein [Candidatus Cryptobacteroides choladohippi]